MRSKFVNGNRTKEQRKARYCFLRNSGFNHNLASILVAFRDKRMIIAIEQYGEFKK
jgi:hypothetical protein